MGRKEGHKAMTQAPWDETELAGPQLIELPPLHFHSFIHSLSKHLLSS